MNDKTKQLEETIKLQDRQIREMKNAIAKLNKQVQQLDKKSVRLNHSLRGVTNQVNQLLSMLKRS